MLRDTLFIARKDLKFMLKERETIFWVFIMPIVFFYFIGTVTSGFGPSGGGQAPKLALQTEGEAPGMLLDQLVHNLEAQDYEVIRPQTDEELAGYRRRLTVPAHFTDSVLAGQPVKLLFEYDGSGFGDQYVTLQLQRAAYTTLADLIVASEMDSVVTAAGLMRLNNMPRTLQLEVKAAGERISIPTGFEQAIPGIMVMFTLMVMATSGAILLLLERKAGLLRRLASTPIDRRSVVLGKCSGKLALGLVQIGFAMLAGTILFKMDWGPSLPAVIAVMIAYGAMMAALGVVLGSIARSEGQAIAIGVISANVLAALGGCWWPIEVAPQWMQRLQLFLPTGWAMHALHKLISFGAGAESVVPHLLGMTAATLILVGVAVKVFKFE